MDTVDDFMYKSRVKSAVNLQAPPLATEPIQPYTIRHEVLSRTLCRFEPLLAGVFLPCHRPGH